MLAGNPITSWADSRSKDKTESGGGLLEAPSSSVQRRVRFSLEFHWSDQVGTADGAIRE